MLKSTWLIPTLFAIVIGTLLIISIPVNFEKYRLKYLRTFEGMSQESYAFADVDGDGIDELIQCGGLATSGVRNSSCSIRAITKGKTNTMDQLNVQELVKGVKQTITSDFDGDGLSEIILFGAEGNDLYLHVFELPNLNEPILKLWVDSLVRENGEPFLTLKQGFERDVNGDGFNEIYFKVSVGFPIYPRRSYRLDVKNGEVLAGPVSSAGFGVVEELSNHPHYLTGNTVSAGNHEDSIDLPYPDLHSYAYVFDEDLRFLFEPIKYTDYPKGCDKAILGDFLFVLREQNDSSVIDKLKVETGELVSSTKMEWAHKMLIYNEHLMLTAPGKLLFLDESLKIAKVIIHKNLASSGEFMDLDIDGKPEYYSKPYLSNTGYIFSSDFDYPIPIDVASSNNKAIFHMRNVAKHQRELVVHRNNKLEFYSYHKSPYYWLRWPYYLCMFIISGLISTVLFKRFRKSIEKRYQQERQLSRLQLLSIKNQVDPHFTLNALNSIDWMYRNNETSKASSFMGKLTRLMNQTVQSSDKIGCTLYEELDFCRNYCQLEKLRDEQFSFEIEVAEEIDSFEIELPKQLIFTHVENAIKHGLRPKEGKKHLWIKAEKIPHGMEIIVKDNGVGFTENAETSGTGKGLKIVEEMVELWARLRKTKIATEMRDGEKGGTVAKIILTNSA